MPVSAAALTVTRLFAKATTQNKWHPGFNFPTTALRGKQGNAMGSWNLWVCWWRTRCLDVLSVANSPEIGVAREEIVPCAAAVSDRSSSAFRSLSGVGGPRASEYCLHHPPATPIHLNAEVSGPESCCEQPPKTSISLHIGPGALAQEVILTRAIGSLSERSFATGFLCACLRSSSHHDKVLEACMTKSTPETLPV